MEYLLHYIYKKNKEANGDGAWEANGDGACKYVMIFMKAQAGVIETPLNKAMLKTQEFQYKSDDYDICLGWFKTNEFIFHSGATNGFFAIAVFNSESKKILLMLSNTNNQKWITGIAMKEMGFHK